MSNNRKKVLAIDPGTREMGVAFFDKDKLIYHEAKTIKKKISSRNTKRRKESNPEINK
jgi:RNase H-fold protein (predicted Holliday junction resolvase)